MGELIARMTSRVGRDLTEQEIQRLYAGSLSVTQEDAEFAIAELCDIVKMLVDFLRAGTMDEAPGEWTAYERAEEVLLRYQSPVP
jgi:hypothetical protein